MRIRKAKSISNESKLLGLSIERKTNLVALAAFVLSLGAILAQLPALLRGPQLKLLPVRQVIFDIRKKDDTPPYIVLVARLNYINTGATGYDDIVLDERATILVGGRKYEQTWLNFLKLPSDTQVKMKPLRDAAPFKVAAGDTVDHHTEFFPRSSQKGQNYLIWSDFSSALTRGDIVSVEIQFKSAKGKQSRTTCRLGASSDILHFLNEKEQTAQECIQTDDE